ncbi:programmed cell death protein 6-like [Ornithodoros turicata]|uniref:programmed cell death protein 6-like n=1 Tax=Ornithodoros turicata TaxID=34597 RepID=UPI00313988BA
MAVKEDEVASLGDCWTIVTITDYYFSFKSPRAIHRVAWSPGSLFAGDACVLVEFPYRYPVVPLTSMSKTPSETSLIEKKDVAYLTSVFKSVDRDQSGFIKHIELQRALANGCWKCFSEDIVCLMIGMFDRTFTGNINLEQFITLWNCITDWINCFKAHSKSCKGRIDKAELQSCMTELGYRLSPGLCAIMIRRFDQMGDYRIGQDDYIRLCIVLYDALDAYNKLDPNKTGTAKINYDDFLHMMFTMSK